MKDYYKILGVEKNANSDQIKRAYRSLALKYHPDRGEEASEEKFKEINEAYQVLGDEAKKRQYDQYGSAGPNMGGGGFNAGGFQGAPGFDFHFDGMGDISDIFESFFGGGANFRAQAARRARNITLMLTVSFEEMLTGASKEITYARITDAQAAKRANEHLTIEIPSGIEDGTTLKLTGKGHLGAQGEEAGDLYVQVRIKPSQVYEREGLDLLRVLWISFPLATLGGSKEVETPSGKVKVKVPAGSEDGKVLRLKGQGIKAKSRQGDLYVRLKILVPKKLTLKQRKMLEELGQEME
jgi:DnaJ-class molecular chaperone